MRDSEDKQECAMLTMGRDPAFKSHHAPSDVRRTEADMSHLLGRHRIMGAVPKDYPRDNGFISGISLSATLRNRQHHEDGP